MSTGGSMWRGPFGWLLAIALFAGAAWLAVQAEPNGRALKGRARAVDGDTLEMGDDRIRLVGIDAPELGQDCADAAGKKWPCGQKAGARLAELVAGHNVACAADGHDKYGRVLATCVVDGRDLGAMMVNEGLAVGDDEYLLEQSKARLKKTGIWAGTFETPRAWRDRNPRDEDGGTFRQWLEGWLGG